MSQVDYDVANADGATVRADLNAMLDAIATNNAGPSAPTTTFANMWWYDTTASSLKRRNSANTAWLLIDPFDDALVTSDDSTTAKDLATRFGYETSVLDWGAKGDNINDDQPAIQAAIDQFENGDGTVYFPAGFYRCTAPITIYRGTRLKGVKARQGATTGQIRADGVLTSGPTRLFFDNGTNGIVTPINWTPVQGAPERAHGCIIEDMVIAGTDRTLGTYGVWLRDNTGGVGNIHPGIIKLNRVNCLDWSIGMNLAGHADGTWITSCDFGRCETGILGGWVDDYVANTFFSDMVNFCIDTSCNRGIYTNLELFDAPAQTRAVGINVRVGTGGERGVGEDVIVDACQEGGSTLIQSVKVTGVNGTKVVNGSFHPGKNAILFSGCKGFVCTGNTSKAHGQTAFSGAADQAVILITGSSSGGVVDNNTFAAGSTFGVRGVQIDAGCLEIEVGSNPGVASITEPLIDNGTRTRIVSKSIDRQTAVINVVNTLVETDLNTVTILANTLRVGRTLRLTAHLDYLNNTGAASNITLRAKLGGTTILTSGTLNRGQNTNRSAVSFSIDILARGSASETIKGHILFGATGSVTGSLLTPAHDISGSHTTFTADLTTNLILKLTAQHGTANASISMRTLSWVVEII